VAFITTYEPGVSVDTITAGEGDSPTEESVVFVRYTGKLEDGTVFDQSQEANWPVPGILPEGTPLPLGNMIPGFRTALLQMQRGGSYTVTIPSAEGYGSSPPPGSPIPPDADLIFDIQLIDFMTEEEAQQRYQSMIMALEASEAAAGEEAAAE